MMKYEKNKSDDNLIATSDYLIVAYDCCPPDVPTLCVARKEGDKIKVLNTIRGNEAFGMYCYLTGFAELMERQGKWNQLGQSKST